MSCVWMLPRGHRGDGCVFGVDFVYIGFEEGRFICSELGARVRTSGAGKCLFRVANV